MATTSYPKLGSTPWRRLRERAATTPSTKFTSQMVATLLDMANPESAVANVVRPMRRMGLIDQDGNLTARGNKWRVDASYGEACQEILDEVYPPELAGFTDSDGTTDRAKVTTWFQHQGFGLSNARQLAATYAMIAEKKLPEAPQPDSGKAKRPAPAPGKRPAPATAPSKPTKRSASEHTATEDTELPEPRGNGSSTGPSIHLDIQIHIPADASAEQIDRIFASMAKHLYPK